MPPVSHAATDTGEFIDLSADTHDVRMTDWMHWCPHWRDLIARSDDERNTVLRRHMEGLLH